MCYRSESIESNLTILQKLVQIKEIYLLRIIKWPHLYNLTILRAEIKHFQIFQSIKIKIK
jgi:hypothetical protein